MTNIARLPGGGEDRFIKCPVCSNVMTRMEAEGVTVDVCAGGAGVTDR
jgi:Zn-finger nucleic acid-binding protein